jgi:hypothetical protein
MTMSSPTCKICGRSEGVQFCIFTPAIPPFGTACVDCEEKLKENLKTLGIDAKPADCEIGDDGEVWYGVDGAFTIVCHGPHHIPQYDRQSD